MLALKRKLMLERQRKRDEEEEEGGEGEEEVMFVSVLLVVTHFLFLSPPFLFPFTVSFLFSFLLSSFFLQCRIWIQSISLQFTRFRSSQLSLLIPC